MIKLLVVLLAGVVAYYIGGGLVRLVYASDIKPDEEVILLPTQAYLNDKQDTWVVSLHGWIFERENDSIWRSAVAAAFIEALDLENDAASSELFRQRAWMFLVDNESSKRLKLKIAGHTVTTDKSGANGHFYASTRLPVTSVANKTRDCWEDVALVLPGQDPRAFRGQVQLLAPQGLSVISDIDDTIKQSNVLDKKALLANTFTKPFVAVAGMPAVYQAWQQQGAMFHYVSSSPWQLYPALHAFLQEAGFPNGSFHLKLFRLKDETALAMFDSPLATKVATISGILTTYPQRKFILVGDSGEKDPEVYAQIYREFPAQIQHIYIRNVTREAAEAPRYRQTFQGIAAAQWTLFTDPATLPRQPGLRTPH